MAYIHIHISLNNIRSILPYAYGKINILLNKLFNYSVLNTTLRKIKTGTKTPSCNRTWGLHGAVRSCGFKKKFKGGVHVVPYRPLRADLQNRRLANHDGGEKQRVVALKHDVSVPPAVKTAGEVKVPDVAFVLTALQSAAGTNRAIQTLAG